MALLSVVVVMAMMVPMMVSAAETTDPTGTIRLESQSESLVLDESKFFVVKLFDLKLTGKDYLYTPVEGIDEIAQLFFEDDEATATQLLTLLKSGPTADEFKKLTEIANESSLTSISGKQGGEYVVFEGLTYGYYLVMGKATAEADDVTAYSALVTVDQDEVKADLKADAPTVKKEVFDHVKDEWDKATDKNVGDEVNFRLTSKVPVTFGYVSYKMIFHDTMSVGLKFDPESVNVKVGEEEFGFTLSPNDGTSPFSITLNDVKGLDGEEIEITYSAILNEDAVVGNPGNPNTVKLEFSNNPYKSGSGEDDDHETGETPDDSVVVCTYEIIIDKVNTGGDKLDGVKFALKDKDNKVIASGETSDGGKLVFSGLDAGIYYIEETETIAPYNKLTDDIEIYITHTHDLNDAKDQCSGAWTVTGNGDNGNVITIVNQMGSVLPGTGGMGTTILYACGGTLAIGIAVAYFISKRREHDDM